MTLTYTHLSFFLNYIWQRCRWIYLYFIFFHIQIFFLVNFHHVANVFYLKIRESSYSALISRANVVLESLKTRIGRSNPSAGRVYFNISREKPAHIHTYIYMHHLYLSSDLQCNYKKVIKWNKWNEGNINSTIRKELNYLLLVSLYLFKRNLSHYKCELPK